MTPVLLFAITLFLAVLVSDLAERSILSTAVLFLAVGFTAGVTGVVRIDPTTPLVSELASLALFMTLFTDGMRVRLGELTSSWRLPARALLVGLPLSIAAIALLGHVLGGLSWHWALLLGAVLAPTDPVFAAAMVERQDLPGGLRRLLNVESGLNDGLALPVVLWLLHGGREDEAPGLAVPLLVGIGVGIVVPWLGDRLERSRLFHAHESYRAMAGFSVALLVLAVTRVVNGNEFLAAFAAGIVVITLRPEISSEFRGFVGHSATLLKFAALFLFGALISPTLLGDLSVADYLVALLVLAAVRPLTLGLALLGSGMPVRERAVAAWFGPKGFASVLYALLVLRAGLAGSERVFRLAAVVIAASIVLHSSTDVPAARWLQRKENLAPERRVPTPDRSGHS
jgi:NhaP-type Na+/H+ or K+/H+ antiporter